MKKCALIFLLSILQKFITAQNLSFQSYSSSQGLSQNSIYSIAQTKDGFMWFGTQDGINRFDGRNFIAVRPAINDDSTTGKGTGQFSKMITALYADNNDRLWVGTTYEILLYNRYINTFVLPAKVYKGFLLPNGLWITKITEDSNNNIWILSQKDGLYCYNKVQQSMVPLSWQGNAPGKIIAFAIDASGRIWACSETEIYLLEGTSFHPVAFHNKFPFANNRIVEMSVVNGALWLILNTSEIILVQPEPNYNCSIQYFAHEFKGWKFLSDARAIHQSDANTVWIGSRSEGLVKINLAEKTFENAGALGTIHSLKTQFILSFFTNKQKITWIGLSGGGVAKYDLQKIQFSLWRNEPRPGMPVADNMLFSIFSDNDEDFYMGTLSGGLLHRNIKSAKYGYYQPPISQQKTGSNNIYEIISGENNLLWMATWGGLYSFDKTTKQFTRYADENDEQTKKLCSVIKLKNGYQLLTGGYEGGLRLFNLKTLSWEKCRDEKKLLDNKQFKLRVRFMKEMGNGDVYMSTEALSLVCYNYLTGKFTFFPQFQKLSGASRYFFRDSVYLWVATDDGMIQASAATRQVVKIWSTQNGLPNNYIYAVMPDNYGRIWISSNAGLAVLDHKTGICKKFTEDDGLQSMEFNTACCYKSPGGKIWFGGINGLNMVNPDLSAGNDYSPAPLVTSINVMNLPYYSDTAAPYVHNISLPYAQNFISFEFQSPNFSQSENIIYEYRLIGVDTGWVKNGTRNYVSYSQLKPGQYRFVTRSANTAYIWSKNSAEISITIIPPWYRTWWFYGLSFFLVTVFLFLFISQRVKSIRYRAESKQKIIETEMAALKAQMNPHFMFNCINSIDAFIHSNDKYNATLYLNKFAKLLRNILDSSKQNTVLLSKDVDTLKLYIEMEELRHENKFSSSIEVDDELLKSDYKVPPLIIQPFVENAILHGLKNKTANDGLLMISIKKEGEKIVFTIQDNGIGRAAAKSIIQNKGSSYGVGMSLDRIKLFNREKTASVQINDLYENENALGTKIIVHLKPN